MKSNVKQIGLIQAWKIDSLTGIINPIHSIDYKGYKKNLVTNVYREDIARLASGTSADIEIKYTELSTLYDAPTRSDGAVLTNSIGRVLPTITRTNNSLLIESSFGLTDANTLGAAGTVTVATVTSTTVFTLSSVTGLLVNDRCSVKLSGAGNKEEQRKVTNISGSQVTVDKAFSVIPVVGDKFYQNISILLLPYGASATITANTGSASSMAQLIATKASTELLLTRHEIQFLG